MNQNTIDNYASEIADYYGVDSSDVTVSTNYETSGTLSLTIPNNISESELIDTVITSLADALGTHPQNVEVTIDMENGEVQFTIISPTFSEAAEVLFDLNAYQNQDDITTSIQDKLPGVSVDDLTTIEDVSVAFEIIVDANNAERDLVQAAWQSQQLLSGFDVTVENVYVTHAPTLAPSQPPSTSIPSQAPSITGIPESMIFMQSHIESISFDETSSIQTEVADTFGVNSEDVKVEVVYQTIGSINIDIPDDVPVVELEEFMERELIILLGVHEGSVEVTIDENGNYLWKSLTEFSKKKGKRIFTTSLSPPSFTFDNYREVLFKEGIGRAFINTLAVALPSTLIPLIICSFFAYALTWMKFFGRDTLLAIIIASLVVPLLMSLIPILTIYNDFGALFGVAAKSYPGVWMAHTGFGGNSKQSSKVIINS
jgi:hypothetical protein